MKRMTLLRGFLASLFLIGALMLPDAAAVAKPICLIGCETGNCTRDRDCPGGHCNFVCPNNGCCAFP
jgi:hypothetical protein